MIPKVTIISGPINSGRSVIAEGLRESTEVEVIDTDIETLSPYDLRRKVKKVGQIILITTKYAKANFPFPHRLIQVSICQS